jgi:phage terminase small subunit
MTTPALSTRQVKFIDEYLIDGNGTQAAKRAGYGASGARVAAYRLLSNVAISSAIEARRQADATRLFISRENVLQGLLEAFDMARENREPAVMVAAAREVGRMMGFYLPAQAKVTLDVAAEAERGRMEALSDTELLKLIEQSGASA